MSHNILLEFIRTAFKKSRLQTLILSPDKNIPESADMGLRKMLNINKEYEKVFYSLFDTVEENVIYKYTDKYLCCYLFLKLPDKQENILLIGPYLNLKFTREKIMELAEKCGIPPRMLHNFENYYGGIPFFGEESQIFTILDTFAEYIWGNSQKFSIIDINRENEAAPSPISSYPEEDANSTVWTMQMMEKRYSYENELMQAVSLGQTHKAELLLSNFSALSFEQRLSDTLRNYKNYCIIMNTLLRKAAENGGVHPVYLDSVSSAFAKEIELISATSGVPAIMVKMYRSYCRLVKKHAIKNYSSPVQKAITCIDSDLTADLSLSALAAMQNVSPAYLSTLFKKETGQTLTEYVNLKRIKLATRLLDTTMLQVQTVAQHCGILDVHYFSKLFKKYTGKTPKEYRAGKK